MKEIAEEETKIENMIYEIRGKQVILGRNLAKLYKTETRIINQIAKRNMGRFPSDFCFQLRLDEFGTWKSQFVISKSDKLGLRKIPYAFTEEGVAMISALLNSEVAIKTSVQIIKAFVLMRNYLSNNLLEQRYINNMVIKHDGDIKLLTESFDKLSSKELKNEIYFEGQIYDAYSKIIDIMSKAKENIVIIDNYADKSVLDMISRMKLKVKLITKEKGVLSKQDIDKYNKQYSNLEVIYDNTFHDRYIILDEMIVYHLGSSINHIGSKTFSINKIEESRIIELLLEEIDKIIK